MFVPSLSCAVLRNFYHSKVFFITFQNLGISLALYSRRRRNTMFILLFTESALRPIQSTSRDVRLCVCVSVCAIAKHPLLEVVETSGQIASS